LIQTALPRPPGLQEQRDLSRDRPDHSSDAAGAPPKDALPAITGFHDIKKEFIMERREREKLHKERERTMEKGFNRGSKTLKPLEVGDRVRVQNQTMVKRIRWDKLGMVVRVMNHRHNEVKIDGRRSTTIRNRRHLRKIPSVRTQDHKIMEPATTSGEKRTVPLEEDTDDEMENDQPMENGELPVESDEPPVEDDEPVEREERATGVARVRRRSM